MIIGLVGLAQSGKDTTAAILIEKFGFERVSFADPLKQIAYDIDPLITADAHLAELVDEFGWDYTKVTYPECRRFLQRLGTEGMRKNVDNDFWVNIAISHIEQSSNSHFVISDMRFVNEYQRIKDRFVDNFVAWRIVRNGTAVLNHASELELDHIPVTCVIDNNGTVQDLAKVVTSAAQSVVN